MQLLISTLSRLPPPLPHHSLLISLSTSNASQFSNFFVLKTSSTSLEKRVSFVPLFKHTEITFVGSFFSALFLFNHCYLSWPFSCLFSEIHCKVISCCAHHCRELHFPGTFALWLPSGFSSWETLAEDWRGDKLGYFSPSFSRFLGASPTLAPFLLQGSPHYCCHWRVSTSGLG